MHLKTVNRILKEKYPFLELVKGKGYFYFIPTQKHYEQALYSLESTSVYVSKCSDLSSEQWVSEADNIVSQIIDLVPPELPTVDYYWEAKDGAGNSYTRHRSFMTDEEALEWANSFRDGYKHFNIWKKIG